MLSKGEDMPSRRDILKMIGTVAAGSVVPVGLPTSTSALTSPGRRYTSHRPPPSKRAFVSTAVEQRLQAVKASIADPKLAWLFENCYPNTLDTTVKLDTLDGVPDTFIITGDIDAMWLRDSSAQVQPYLPLTRQDAHLRRLFRGLIHRQTRCIQIDPYANAFMPDPHAHTNLSWAQHDLTEMKPGVAERKWEIDSLCYPIRLAHGYWKATGDISPFDEDWRGAMHSVVATFKVQQREHGRGPYHFQRASPNPTDTQFLGGYGNPTRPNGMIHGMFRPSDDACIYPLFVPGNLFAVASLRQLAAMSRQIHHDADFADECTDLAREIEHALQQYGHVRSRAGATTWAYEIDGYGNQLFMDDANAPGLLSLPYLGCCDRDDALYQRTRAAVLSDHNPYFFSGDAASGIGGPHEGLGMIWPMSIIFRALTSDSDAEIRRCLTWLKTTDAGTGFMHEAFDKNDPKKFTRPWFAWANTLFGELIVRLHEKRPDLLRV